MKTFSKDATVLDPDDLSVASTAKLLRTSFGTFAATLGVEACAIMRILLTLHSPSHLLRSAPLLTIHLFCVLMPLGKTVLMPVAALAATRSLLKVALLMLHLSHLTQLPFQVPNPSATLALLELLPPNTCNNFSKNCMALTLTRPHLPHL